MPRAQKQEPSEAQLAARAAGAERLRAAAEARKSVPPVVIRNAVESGETSVQEAPRTMQSTGPAREALEPRLVEPVGKYVDPEKLRNLAFMEEMINVVVHPSTNKTDVQFPEVWNGGRKEIFQRGVEKRVARRFVEVLARMKQTTYVQQKVQDSDGVEQYRYIPQSAPVYPFAVIGDSPKGDAWLKAVLAEA